MGVVAVVAVVLFMTVVTVIIVVAVVTATMVGAVVHSCCGCRDYRKCRCRAIMDVEAVVTVKAIDL